MSSLIDRILTDRDKGLSPDIVVVTGDIAFQGIKDEYDQAAVFFDRLLQGLDLSKKQIFIVPGNHDVNRQLYRASDIPSYHSMRALNEEFENRDFRNQLLKGQQAYFEFIHDHYAHLSPLEENLVPFVQTFETTGKKRLGLMGLNSAWMCRKSPDRGEVAIGEFQLKKAREYLDAQAPCDLNLACFHHPLDWLWKPDREIVRRYLDDFVVLTGHLHDAGGGYTHDTEGRIYTFSAGGAYLGSDSEYPMGYNYLTVDWDDRSLKLNYRTFLERNRRWIPDSCRGNDSKAVIPCVFLPDEVPEQVDEESPTSADRDDDGLTLPSSERSSAAPVDIPANYCELLKDHCSYMEVGYLQRKGQAITVGLPELFIPLYADDPDAKKGAFYEGMQEQDGAGLPVEKKPMDIQKLIEKKDALVIRGNPGSGKTTLLKHLTYTLANQKADLDGLKGFFPALLFLKDLNGRLPKENLTLEQVFTDYYDGEKKGLASLAFSAAQNGHCLLMLDGLDEIEKTLRKDLVNCIADFRQLHFAISLNPCLTRPLFMIPMPAEKIKEGMPR